MANGSDKYFPLHRSLAILRHLQRDVASRVDLIEWVQITLGFDAYKDVYSKASQRAFESDIKRLKDLGVDAEYDRGENVYRLNGYADFSPVGLSEQMLKTLAFLIETFGSGSPNGDNVQQLIRTISDWLPATQRESLSGRRHTIRMDLRRKDDDEIASAVQSAVDRAISQRRLLRFAYRSPSQTDGMPRIHTVQPWGYHFDTVRQHLYLDAYRVQVTGPYGDWRKGVWQLYRLGRIIG